MTSDDTRTQTDTQLLVTSLYSQMNDWLQLSPVHYNRVSILFHREQVAELIKWVDIGDIITVLFYHLLGACYLPKITITHLNLIVIFKTWQAPFSRPQPRYINTS